MFIYPIKIIHPTMCPNSNCFEIEIVSPCMHLLVLIARMHTYITSYKTPIALRGVQAQFFFFLCFSRETNSCSTHCRNNNNNGNNNNNNIISFLLDGEKKNKHLHKLEPTDGRSRVCFSARTESFFV